MYLKERREKKHVTFAQVFRISGGAHFYLNNQFYLVLSPFNLKNLLKHFLQKKRQFLSFPSSKMFLFRLHPEGCFH